MTQKIIHTQRKNTDVGSEEVLSAGEIIYFDSNRIKIGDDEKTLNQLPEFVTGTSFVDNSTITIKSDQKIEAIGTKNKNTSSANSVVFDWVGTKAEYNAQKTAGNIPDSWVCFIEDDDVTAIADNVYTKQESDSKYAAKPSGNNSTAVMTTGEQSIDGNKMFLNGSLKTKSTSIDSKQNPISDELMQMNTALDKNGQIVGIVEVKHLANGDMGVQVKAAVDVNSSTVYSPIIGTYISQDGQTKYTKTETPSSATVNDTQIATTEHVMNVLKAIYPVGAIYIGTQTTCPMSTFFGTWELVSSGKALWTGDGTNATQEIPAGLPNITGSFSTASDKNLGTGAFSWTNDRYSTNGGGQGGQWGINFDASSSSSIYGNSTTVQPPAYVVNVWRRTA